MNPTQNEKAIVDEISAADFHTFRDCLRDVSGIILGDTKKNLITSRLSGIISDNKLNSFADLLDGMKTDAVLRESIMNALTISESTWFREPYPFEVLKEKLLPELAIAQPQVVRIWSAACLTGEEPYSLSMAADEYMQNRPDSLPSNSIKILGTDISPTAINKAMSGAYEQVAVSRGLSADKKQQYFEQADGNWLVKETIKERVTFSELDLRQDFKNLGQFDVIICRNALTYFSSRIRRDIVSRLAAALNRGGYLVVGGSESIADYAEYFELINWRDGVVYKLKS